MSIDLRESPYYQMILDEGRQEGRQEGQLVAVQNTLLRLAGRKFRSTAPNSAEAAVRALTDRERLERMTDRIFDATSWDDPVTRALQRIPPPRRP